MSDSICSTHQQLVDQAEQVLKRIVELTTFQLSLFQRPDHQISMEADRELERAVGEKERLFGALRQHRSEHGC